VGYNSDHSSIGGGQNNAIMLPNAYQSVIGGGANNVITGSYGTIAGGDTNRAGDSDAVVGGGDHNHAMAHDATVSGGGSNVASGGFATVPGGLFNIAQGQGSFAAGQNAQALHDGSFVWSDTLGGASASTANNRFSACAHGGFYFDSGGGNCTLPGGGNAWTCSSDRALKTNFAAVDGKDVLARLANMPVTFWSMKSQDPSIRHIGPVAQDFYAAFNIGEDDTHIGMLDEGGVALAAIQGLNQVVQEQDAEISALKSERAAQQQQIAALDARVTTQDARLAALEQAVNTNGALVRPAADGISLSMTLLLGGLLGGGVLIFLKQRGLGARK
jgi:trimeric autotransporter adhesin